MPSYAILIWSPFSGSVRGSDLTAFARPGDLSPLEGFTRAGKHALGLLFPEAPARPPTSHEILPSLQALALCAVVAMTLVFHFFGQRLETINA